jgi:NAD(P)-dependent dehydrogenase (short-subunit alcohol dehydrogenase family)
LKQNKKDNSLGKEAKMNNRKVALITGANKGIGYEIARQLGGQGFTVLVGARDEAKGAEAAARLRDERLDAQAVKLDVTDAATIAAAKKFVEERFGKLDILVNNAAIIGKHAWDTAPSELALEHIREVFETNFFGVIAVTQAFAPLLKKSDAGRIVNVSSGLGSLTQLSDRNNAFYTLNILDYNASKTALNAFTVSLAKEFQGTPIKVNAADPGYTATDMNAHSGTQTVEEGADTAVWLATLPDDGPTGGYFSSRRPIPW